MDRFDHYVELYLSSSARKRIRAICSSAWLWLLCSTISVLALHWLTLPDGSSVLDMLLTQGTL